MKKTVKYESLTLALNDSGTMYKVKNCKKDATSVTIPEYIDGIPVLAISDAAFKDCTLLRSVSFPEHEGDIFEISTGFNIGVSAFRGCTSLESIELPYNLHVSVENGAFSDCTSLKKVIHHRAYFYSYAFAYCSSLEEIPPLNYINEGVFSHCKSLSVFPVTSNVIDISEDAFEHCDSLTDITIPASVRRIEALAFRGCKSLKSVRFESPDDWYVNIHSAKSNKLDLSDPERNAQRLSRMDFDDGIVSWYKKQQGDTI